MNQSPEEITHTTQPSKREILPYVTKETTKRGGCRGGGHSFSTAAPGTNLMFVFQRNDDRANTQGQGKKNLRTRRSGLSVGEAVHPTTSVCILHKLERSGRYCTLQLCKEAGYYNR